MLRNCIVCDLEWSRSRALTGKFNGMIRYFCKNCGMESIRREDDPMGSLARESDDWKSDLAFIDHFYEPQFLRKSQLCLGLLKVAGLESGSLADVGCGYGRFIHDAKEKGYEVTGIEPSQTAAAIAKDKFGLSVLGQSYDDLSLSPKSQDAISLLDVLEHQDDPHKFLESVKAHSRNLVLISVPNRASLTAKACYWANRLTFGLWSGPLEMLVQSNYQSYHRWYFDPKTLTRLVKKCGLEVVKIESHPMIGPDIIGKKLDFGFAPYSGVAKWGIGIALRITQKIEKCLGRSDTLFLVARVP